jgi:hypothetical protein
MKDADKCHEKKTSTQSKSSVRSPWENNPKPQSTDFERLSAKSKSRKKAKRRKRND